MRSFPTLRARSVSIALTMLWSALALIACDTARLQSPAVPTPPLAATTGLAISGLETPLAVGQSAQLMASVTLQDGTQKLTRDAAWGSSDESIATVSSTGILTVVGLGGADITATAQQHVASVHLRVPFVIAGVIHESFPTEDVPLAGVRVEVQGGVDAGAFAITDSSGRFTLNVEAAGFALAVSKDGYEPASSVIGALPRDQRQDIGLVPAAATAHSSFTGSLCTIAPWGGLAPCWGNDFPYPLEARHRVPVHRAGRATVSVRYRYVGDYYWNHLTVQLLCRGQVVIEKRIDNLHDRIVPDGFEVALPQACAYEVRLFDYIADRKGGHWTTYAVEIDHPR